MTRAAIEVAEGVLVMTSRRYATNTTVVVAGNEAILIDPSWDPDEIPDARVVIVGDMLSDVEVPYPDEDDADLVPYLVGLDRLTDVVHRSAVLVPGHGTPTDDPRLDDPEMKELHEWNMTQAARPYSPSRGLSSQAASPNGGRK